MLLKPVSSKQEAAEQQVKCNQDAVETKWHSNKKRPEQQVKLHQDAVETSDIQTRGDLNNRFNQYAVETSVIQTRGN